MTTKRLNCIITFALISFFPSCASGPENDLKFAKMALESWVRGDSKTEEYIDWDIFYMGDEFIGGKYTQANEKQKETFRKEFVTALFAKILKSGKGVDSGLDSFSNWRVISSDSSRTVVGFDTVKKTTSIITVSKRDGKKRISGIDFKGDKQPVSELDLAKAEAEKAQADALKAKQEAERAKEEANRAKAEADKEKFALEKAKEIAAEKKAGEEKRIRDENEKKEREKEQKRLEKAEAIENERREFQAKQRIEIATLELEKKNKKLVDLEAEYRVTGRKAMDAGTREEENIWKELNKKKFLELKAIKLEIQKDTANLIKLKNGTFEKVKPE